MESLTSVAMSETETTLRLTAEERQNTLLRLKALDRIGPYSLLNPRRETVRDSYLDTPGRRLRSARFALRIRKLHEETRITLKGPATKNPDGSRTRLEIELPWTAESTARVFRELASRGLTLKGDWNHTELPSRDDLMAGARLEPFQSRIMVRETRDVVAEGTGSASFAEMVIDQVAYSPDGHECRHAEMELELRPGADPALLGPVAQLFLATFEDRLVLWLHGKLSIGLALGKLMENGPAPELLDSHNWLTEEAYRRIRETLKG
jgi:inorganic triphosphatase YgiF